MKRVIAIILCVVFIVFSVTGCSVSNHEDTETDEMIYQPDSIRNRKNNFLGDNKDKVTVMIYMIGSSLESEEGLASKDIEEMLRAKTSENLNIIIQTGGTENWHTKEITSGAVQRFEIKDQKLVSLENDLGKVSMTDGESLSSFITYANDKYKSDRNILIFWGHGSGPVYGFGTDEVFGNKNNSLTIDKISNALKTSNVIFDSIMFDSCLMSSLETACALYDYADYMIASEDFESSTGFDYEKLLSDLADNSSIPTVKLASNMIDAYVEDADNNGDEHGGLSVTDLCYMKLLYSAWTNFAYAQKDKLLSYNYSIKTEAMSKTVRVKDIDEYYICDMSLIAKAIGGNLAETLISVLDSCVVYNQAVDDVRMGGLSVTLPYGDDGLAYVNKIILENLGFDKDYLEFTLNFINFKGDFYEWTGDEKYVLADMENFWSTTDVPKPNGDEKWASDWNDWKYTPPEVQSDTESGKGENSSSETVSENNSSKVNSTVSDSSKKPSDSSSVSSENTSSKELESQPENIDTETMGDNIISFDDLF